MVDSLTRAWMIVGVTLIVAGCTDDSERPADAASEADVAPDADAASEADVASDADVALDADVASDADVADTSEDVSDLGLPDVGDATDTDVTADASLEDVVPEGCGDGTLAPWEECDDWNPVSGDGCSSACRIEEGWGCRGPLNGRCELLCGNGVADGGEECDDGNLESSDGCVECTVEGGWVCDDAFPTSCERLCGNGLLDADEECDSGDERRGCIECEVVPNWRCSGEPSVCEYTCGDGLLDPGEECDDGVSRSAGCLGCVVTPGWACSGTPSVCRSLCGDGEVDAVEECDDGNNLDGDGCSAECLDEACGNGVLDDGEACDGVEGCGHRCEPELGWSCSGGTCFRGAFARCGNGIVDPAADKRVWWDPEQCDDANELDGDGCSTECQLEEGWTCLGEPSVCEPSCGTAENDGPCTWAANAPDGGCEPVPRAWGTHCVDTRGQGYCDYSGACIPGSICAELPEGWPCDDGTGALDLRCSDGACVVDTDWDCDAGVTVADRCWPRAEVWRHRTFQEAYAVSDLVYFHLWDEANIVAWSSVGVGRRAPQAFAEGHQESRVFDMGCHLLLDADPRECLHACSSASVSGEDGPARSRVDAGGGSARLYVTTVAEGDSRSASSLARVEIRGFDFGDCPFWACDTWAMVDGECVSTCPGARECDGAWTNVDDDDENCGECGVVCADDHTCMDGLCVCRFDTETDPDNCGACGNVCDAGASCVEGACVCPFDTESDPDNCGACGNVCPERRSCVEGVCECDADVVAENPAACDGCPTGFTGRYCELACPVGSLGEPCGGPDYGVCVTRDGEAVCECFDGGVGVQPNCDGGYPECTLESSHPW